MLADLKHAWRQLEKSPGFALSWFPSTARRQSPPCFRNEVTVPGLRPIACHTGKPILCSSDV
jgi:hypothetical protein